MELSWSCTSVSPEITYGRKSVDRIVTKSMTKNFNLWRLIVVDCDYADSYGLFLD